MDVVNIGIPGVERIQPGTHLCVLYSSSAQRDSILFPFLREGIRGGDKCLCHMDGMEPAAVRARAASQSHRDEQALSVHLDVRRAAEVYLESGRFSVDRMISVMSKHLLQAVDGNFRLLRAAGEMPWRGVVLQPRGADDFFVYESALNELVRQQPAVLMCMYDLQRFGVPMLVPMLQTHPMVLVDRTVLVNPHRVAPAPYRPEAATLAPSAHPPANDSGSPELGVMPDPWASLTEAELRVAELVTAGLTNREIGQRLVVSPHTVDAHLKHAYTKLSIHSRVELTVLAIQHGASGT